MTLTFDRREIRVVLDLKISRNETSGASNYRVLENGALSSREIISETNDGYITVDVLNGDFANVTNSVYRQHKCNFIFAEIIKISSFHYTSNTRKHSKLELSKNLDQYIFTFETKIFVLNRKVSSETVKVSISTMESPNFPRESSSSRSSTRGMAENSIAWLSRPTTRAPDIVSALTRWSVCPSHGGGEGGSGREARARTGMLARDASRYR